MDKSSGMTAWLRVLVAVIAAALWLGAGLLPASAADGPPVATMVMTADSPCPDHAGGGAAPSRPPCCIGAACALHCLPVPPSSVSAGLVVPDAPRVVHPLPVPAVALAGAPAAGPWRPPRILV